MLIPNIPGNVAQAMQPPRHTSEISPDFVAVSNAKADITVATGTATDLPKIAVRQVAEQQAAAPQLQNVVDQINKTLKQNNKNLEFTIDTETQKPMVKLIDTETGDIIRQFPSEEAIAISKAIEQMQQGLLLKQKA